MSRTAFVTGATGFLGTHLVRLLLQDGWQVHALRRQHSDVSAFADLTVHWHIGDVTDSQSLLNACPDQADAVFHVAADTSMWRKYNSQQDRINLSGTENIIKMALAKHAKRLIHTSSIAAYGHHSEAITEQSEQRGQESFCNYYRTKHLSELMVKQAIAEQKLDAVILNPCHLVGAYDKQNWSQMIVMVAEKTLPGVPPGFGSFCDIKEIAKAHIAAVDKGICGENYILSGADMSFVEFVGTIGKLVGQPTPSKPVPAWALKTLAQLSALFANITRKEPDITPEKAMIVCEKLYTSSVKAQQQLGYRADIDIEQVLKECIDWMRLRNMITAG